MKAVQGNKRVAETARHPLFVYGTLLRGQPNRDLLRGRTVRTLPGWMTGVELYALGAFPMMVEGRGRVVGEVIYLRPDDGAYAAALAMLDRLEGVDRSHGLYRRVLRSAWVAPGRAVSAWVYLGRREMVRGRPRVESGDWIAFLAMR